MSIEIFPIFSLLLKHIVSETDFDSIFWQKSLQCETLYAESISNFKANNV